MSCYWWRVLFDDKNPIFPRNFHDSGVQPSSSLRIGKYHGTSLATIISLPLAITTVVTMVRSKDKNPAEIGNKNGGSWNNQWQIIWCGTVDASEIRRSPVEVGSLSHYRILDISGACLGFLKHQQYFCWWLSHRPSRTSLSLGLLAKHFLDTCSGKQPGKLLFTFLGEKVSSSPLSPNKTPIVTIFTHVLRKKSGENSARPVVSKVTLIVVEHWKQKQLENNHRFWSNYNVSPT